MSAKSRILSNVIVIVSVLSLFLTARQSLAAPLETRASQACANTLPVVAIHVSELTQALETITASSSTPTGSGTTGFEWWPASWHYFVMYESLEEALRSDGTPFIEVTDADISAGQLLNTDGSLRYPIVISLASEAIRDDEVAPLRDYVAAGGFLFVGSSSFTRKPDGTTRGDFALATELGLHMVNANLQNWYENMTFSKVTDHRLVTHIPVGDLSWRMPLAAEEIPWGITPTHLLHGLHNVWQVNASDATIIANGSQGPILTTKSYGAGHLIYHGAMQPLIGHGGFDSGMYAYGIYRNAIAWAFESANLPIVKVSPWRYPYDAAFVIRHDAENDPSLITTIEASAQFENSVGAKGDYYFTTGTVRANSEDTQLTEQQKLSTVASLQRAVSLYGATIGSHNGGLGNPVVSVPTDAYDYWHWGPDEALETTPPGYANGKTYAYESISTSFQDIEGWLAGLDNGRAGCGVALNCPRTWAAPYFNGAREDSNDIVEQLGAITTGEQKIGPFPHRTLSYNTPGKRFATITLPLSDWYVGTDVAQARELHTTSSIDAAIDFYYDLGALINIYGHAPSNLNTLAREYLTHAMSKPRVWATNAVGVYDWWDSRSSVTITPSYTQSGETGTASATITGATDPDTAIELVIPYWNAAMTGDIGDIEVLFNGAPADPAEYRATNYGLKVRVGTTVSNVQVNYSSVLRAWTQSEWSGGPGQATWVDSTRYQSASGIDNSIVGQVGLSIASGGDILFTDDFTRSPDPSPAPFTWVIPTTSPTNTGVFDTSGGQLHTAAGIGSYGYAYTSTLTISNHSVEADIRFPQANTLGGGIFGRLNAANGQRYAAWLYPEGSPGVPGGYGPAVIRLIKFYSWGAWEGSLGLQTVSVPAVGSGWHHLRLAFNENQIQVFYDDSVTPIIDVTDTDAGGFPPYLTGYVGVDLATSDNTNGPIYDNYTVRDTANTVVLSDDFGAPAPGALLPWISQGGDWTVSDGLLQGSGSTNQYANVYTSSVWTNFSVEGRIQLPAGAFGGGIGGRLDPATGAHYGAWIYPASVSGGTNVIRLIKFHDWTSWSGTPMQQVEVPDVGTGWYTLKMAFDGNRIRVYDNGNQVIDVTDTDYDSLSPYLSGGISVDLWTNAATYVMLADDVIVRSSVVYTNSGTLLSSAFDGGVGARWRTIAWDAAAGDSTGVHVRTRTANQLDQLSSAPWSEYYTTSGMQVTSPNARWIQYESELTTSTPSASPILYEIGISYMPAWLVSISASNPGIVLNWQQAPCTTEYQVYGSAQPYFTPIHSPEPDGNLLDTVETGTTYPDPYDRSIFFYAVRAANSAGGGSDSNQVGRFTFAIVPGTSP